MVLLSANATLYTLHSTLYTLHSTLYILHSTLYTLHTTLYTLHVTLYTLKWVQCKPFVTHINVHTYTSMMKNCTPKKLKSFMERCNYQDGLCEKWNITNANYVTSIMLWKPNQYKITIGIIFLILAYLDLTIFNRDFNIFGQKAYIWEWRQGLKYLTVVTYKGAYQ